MQATHARLITAAARQYLRPLGCQQQGRSRLWYADQGFWAVVIEFQPSGWQKGSFLNAGAMWLWYAKGYWSFDESAEASGGLSRIGSFVPFQDAAQFEPEAQRLALRAAQAVQDLRARFATLPSVAQYLVANARGGRASEWAVYHAAVAAGLVGDVEFAAYWLGRLTANRVPDGWQRQLQTVAGELAAYLPDVERFQGAILKIIAQMRALHRLPPSNTPFEPSAPSPSY